jgi:hypothetical protein
MSSGPSTSPPSAPAPALTARLAIFSAVAFVAVNVAFFVLSISYFDSHREVVNGVSTPYSSAAVMHVRMAFGLSAAVVTVVTFVVGLDRRVLGHVLVGVLGAAMAIGGIVAVVNGLPAALIVLLMVPGSLMPVLALSSHRGGRAAWSFLLALCAVLAFASLFGAPRLRDTLQVSLWTTMMLPALYAVAAVTMYLLRNDYVDRAPVRA